MSGFLDHLVWLANFPTSTGYVWVFIASLGAAGLGMRAFRRPGKPSRLDELRRERERPFGLHSRPALRALRIGVTWLARVAFVLTVAAGILGIAGMSGPAVIRAYIHDHGAVATGVLDDDFVTFTAGDGQSYTLPYDFFASPAYPDQQWWSGADEVVVRYLPSHPQAYVVDTDRSPGG